MNGFYLPVPGFRALQQTLCVPSSPHQRRPFSACRLPQLDMALEDVAWEAVEVQGAAAEAVVGRIIGSTLTPVCHTCSKALNKNTWTLCMSERLTWQDQAMDRGTGTGTDPTHIRTHIHNHIRTGFHQPT